MYGLRWIKEIMQKKEQRYKEITKQEAVKKAQEMFGAEVYDNNLWLTCDGNLIVPFSVLNEKTDIAECVALVEIMRNYYIERAVK